MEIEYEILLKHAWKDGAERLRKVGIKTPLLDSRLLLQHVLGINYEELLTSAKRPITKQESDDYNDLLSRRVLREPVSLILGKKEFWSMEFKTTVDTLDPRPETECLIENVLENFGDRARKHKFLDLGTGTGAIALALLKEYPEASAVAVDISDAALEVAKENAKRHGLEKRVEFIKSNWFEKVKGKFDIIVSNPPYISSKSIDFLPAEVRLYDPKIALDGGEDGLNEYIAIAENLSKHLAENGKVFIEIGKWQEGRIGEILKSKGFIIHSVKKDLAQVPRVICFSKPYIKLVK
jgi:release factor glutamine methyltransferase